MPALLKFLVLLASFHSGSYAHAFTSLSPVAGNQVRVNHLIRFQQPMSNPTNEPSREPIREPTNDRQKSEPIVSNSQIKRDKSTPTFQLVVAFVSNINALSFNDKLSSTFQLVVASVADKTLHQRETIETTSTSSKTIGPSSKFQRETIETNSTSSETIGSSSKPIFTSEKTNGCQQLTHSANFEGGRLASLLLTGHKSVGIQPTSLHLTNKSRQSPSFVDDVSIDSWQCQMEINTVKVAMSFRYWVI